MLLTAACASASMLVAGIARADMPRTARLEVKHADGAEACPGAERVREALAVAAGVDVVDASSPARLVFTLAAAGDLARGRWELVDENGATIRTRSATVTGTCTQLVAELALAFAVAWETAPAPCTCDAACMQKAREELLAEGYVRRMDLTVAVLGGALLSANYTADPGAGMFLAGELHRDWFSGALEARVLFPSRVVAEPTEDEFDITALTAALVPCARWKVVLGCAFVDFGMLLTSRAEIATNPITATLGFGPRVAVHIPFAQRFAVRAFVDLRFAPVPSTRNFLDTGGRWESNLVSGLFGLGLSFE